MNIKILLKGQEKKGVTVLSTLSTLNTDNNNHSLYNQQYLV